MHKPLVGLDIETLSRPKDAALAGKVPVMTTWAFAAMMPDSLHPIILAGVMPVRELIDKGFHINADTLTWWMTSPDNEQARKAQVKHLNRQKHGAYLMKYDAVIDEYVVVDHAVTRGGVFDLMVQFRHMVGKGAHFVGNGCEFDMSIFDQHFDHPVYKFTEVGSARSFKWIARQTMPEFMPEIERIAEDYAVRVTNKLPDVFKADFLFVQDWHDALFDVINEVRLCKEIFDRISA